MSEPESVTCSACGRVILKAHADKDGTCGCVAPRPAPKK